MSAYICNPETFAALATFGYQAGVRGRDGQRLERESIAATLYAANVASVNHRYGESESEELPGGEFVRLLAVPAMWVVKACDCVQYQSCERGDYYSSEAWEILEQIRRAAVRALPGYDDAPWGVPSDACLLAAFARA